MMILFSAHDGLEVGVEVQGWGKVAAKTDGEWRHLAERRSRLISVSFLSPPSR